MGVSVFPVSSESSPHSVASYDTQGDVRTYSNPDPHGLFLKYGNPAINIWLKIVFNSNMQNKSQVLIKEVGSWDF
jgi:hypothetical protein